MISTSIVALVSTMPAAQAAAWGAGTAFVFVLGCFATGLIWMARAHVGGGAD